MKLNIVKESFGPYRISASKLIDKSEVQKYAELGGLYEMERKPAGAAEKLFWTEKNAKGELVRGSNFTRSQDIPVSDKAKAQIVQVLSDAGYDDISVEVREVKSSEPAWKQKVAAYVGLPELDEDITPEQVKGMVAKLIAKMGLNEAEVMTYAKSKGLSA